MLASRYAQPFGRAGPMLLAGLLAAAAPGCRRVQAPPPDASAAPPASAPGVAAGVQAAANPRGEGAAVDTGAGPALRGAEMDRARAQLREQGVIIVPVDRERFVPVPELGGSLRYDGRKHGDGTGTEPSSTLQQFSFRKEGDRLGGAFGPYMWIHEDGIGQLEGRWLRLVYWGSGHVCLRMLKGEPRRRPRSRPPQGIGESALNVDLRSRPEPARAKPEDPLVQLCRRALGEDTPQDAGKDERGTP